MADASKLDHDTYKHITTLSSASLILVATFLEKTFQHPSYKSLAIISMLSFLLSIITAVFAMFNVAYTLHIMELPDEERKRLHRALIPGRKWGFWVSMPPALLLLLGMLMLFLFASFNLN